LFNNTKYVTPGIKESVPAFLQNILWYMVETMEDIEIKDYLQVFVLDSICVDGKQKQMIIHSQEQPDYRKEYAICTKRIISGKIYVIDDKTHSTMLLAEEY
jgi:hypothetical protein